MPQELENQFKMPTAEQMAEMPGDRETKAARNLMVRKISGIPRKAFLTGDNDHAPILMGLVDLTTAIYALLDAIPARTNSPLSERAAAVQAILEHHGCN